MRRGWSALALTLAACHGAPIKDRFGSGDPPVAGAARAADLEPDPPSVDMAGVRPGFAQTALVATNRPLDLVIDGRGFFAVMGTDGSPLYTRDGNWHINRYGALCTASGAVLQPRVSLPSDVLELDVDAAGRCTGRTASAPDAVTVFGRLLVNRFDNPEGLDEVGDNCWRRSDASGPPIRGTPGMNGLGRLVQGFVERPRLAIARQQQ